MSRAWRREARERKRLRPDEERVALEQRIAETIQEDAHAAGHHAIIPSRTCPGCRAEAPSPRRAIGLS